MFERQILLLTFEDYIYKVSRTCFCFTWEETLSGDYPSATASSKQSSIAKWYVTFPGAALVLSALLLGVTATSAQPADETFTPVADIQIPCIPNQVPCLSANNQFGFDISFVDPQTDLLFVTDA
jgi:hypothetical protein